MDLVELQLIIIIILAMPTVEEVVVEEQQEHEMVKVELEVELVVEVEHMEEVQEEDFLMMEHLEDRVVLFA